MTIWPNKPNKSGMYSIEYIDGPMDSPLAPSKWKTYIKSSWKNCHSLDVSLRDRFKCPIESKAPSVQRNYSLFPSTVVPIVRRHKGNLNRPKWKHPKLDSNELKNGFCQSTVHSLRARCLEKAQVDSTTHARGPRAWAARGDPQSRRNRIDPRA